MSLYHSYIYWHLWPTYYEHSNKMYVIRSVHTRRSNFRPTAKVFQASVCLFLSRYSGEQTSHSDGRPSYSTIISQIPIRLHSRFAILKLSTVSCRIEPFASRCEYCLTEIRHGHIHVRENCLLDDSRQLLYTRRQFLSRGCPRDRNCQTQNLRKKTRNWIATLRS